MNQSNHRLSSIRYHGYDIFLFTVTMFLPDLLKRHIVKHSKDNGLRIYNQTMSSIPNYGKEIRMAEFSNLRRGSIFLNHGSFGVVPGKINEIHHKYIDLINEHPDDWFRRKNFDLWIKARNKTAEFVNCDPEDLVFVENVTTGVNTVLSYVALKDGEAILATDQTYSACKYACFHSAARKEVAMKVLKIGLPVYSDEDIVELYDKYLIDNPDIRIAVIDHITSATALVMPVKRLVQVCRKHNVLSLIDGAHAPGQLLLDIKDVDADIYAGNMSKWCFTPIGCSFLYIKKEHQSWIHPLVTSYNHKLSITEAFFMQGSRDDTPYLTVPSAIQFYENIGGVEGVVRYNSSLLDKATDMVISSWGTEKLPVPKSMEAPCMRLIRLPDIPGYTLTKEELKEERDHPYDERLMDKLYLENDIQTQVFVLDKGTYIRLSAHVYNHIEEYELLCETIKILSK